MFLHISDDRETRTRRNVDLDVTFPSQAIPAQGRTLVGETDPHTAKLSADYTKENKYSLVLEHFSFKWTKSVLPNLRVSQRCSKFLLGAALEAGSYHNARDSPKTLVSLQRGLEVWRLKVLPNNPIGIWTRGEVYLIPVIQQCRDFNPDFRPKHTLKLTHSCFADHSSRMKPLWPCEKAALLESYPGVKRNYLMKAYK